MSGLRWVAFAAGIGVVAGTGGSVLRTLVLPRGLTSRLSTLLASGAVRRGFLFVANRFGEYDRKDRILALAGPVSLLTVLLAWLALFLFGYSLILVPFVDVSFPEVVREVGSSMLTLGFATTPSAGATVVDFLAAATGLIIVALEIAYLPVIYAAFNRRETLITLLQSRAGSPAWGPELLARHKLVGLLDSLPHLYLQWEEWAADVAESHANYPVLVWFRSPHPLRSWVVGLVAVLDSAALYLSLAPERAPSEARLCLRMGFTCLRDIAETLGLPYDPDPFPTDPIELTFEDFRGAIHRLESVDFEVERTPEEAWPHFRGWRVNYESIVYQLADLVVAPPGPWTGPRHHLPGMEIVPLRPTDRRPEDVREAERPRGHGVGW